MRQGKRRDDHDERPQPPKRDHQAAQEQQVVGAVENVPEAGHDKTQRGLVPPGIEAYQAGFAPELERARGAAGWQEAQCRGDFLPEPVDAQADREFGTVGLDRILKQDVEQLLVPIELQIVGKRGPFQVRTRLLIRRERSVGRQRHARVEDAGRWKRRAVFVDGDVIDQMELRSVAQWFVGAG